MKLFNKETNKVYALKVVNELIHLENSVGNDENYLIFEVVPATFVIHDHSKFESIIVYNDLDLEKTSSIPDTWIFKTQKEADAECDYRNKRAFRNMGRRILDLESKFNKIEKALKSISSSISLCI